MASHVSASIGPIVAGRKGVSLPCTHIGQNFCVLSSAEHLLYMSLHRHVNIDDFIMIISDTIRKSCHMLLSKFEIMHVNMHLYLQRGIASSLYSVILGGQVS